MPDKKYEPFSILLDSRLMETLYERSSTMSRGQALIDLIARRASSPTVVRKHDHFITLQPGEADTSVHLLADEWGWDRKTVRKFLKILNDCGIMITRKTTFAAISTFPTIRSSSANETLSSPPFEDVSTISAKNPSTPVQPVQSDLPSSRCEGSVRYDMAPLDLTNAERQQLKDIYALFRSRLPRLDLPEYSDRTEKAIYYLFVLGMHEDHDLLNRYLDLVAGDPMMNGEMAELSGDPRDKETFVSLFSPRWQELLFPVSPSKCR